MTHNVCLVICTVALAFSPNVLAEQQADLVRSELTDGITHELRPAGYWNPIKAFIELQTVQPDVGHGIEFLIEIHNPTSQPLEMDEPIRFMNVQLWNAEDVRVEIPDPAHGRSPEHDRRPEPLRRQLEERRPFHAGEPQWFQRPSDVKSVGDLKDGKVTLDPGDKFQATVKITKIMADPQKWWAEIEKRSGKPPSGLPGPDPPPVAPLPRGTYKVQVFLPLMINGKLVPSKSHDRIMVRLGSE